jgi:hypothetical protein
MNDQMAAILEAHREVVVREFVAWLVDAYYADYADLNVAENMEYVVTEYLAYCREKAA